jgi:SAM-dependent methyltransferase
LTEQAGRRGGRPGGPDAGATDGRAGYSDEQVAALYEVLNPWGPSDDFYLALVMGAGSVLDVGCGTGALLRRAREAGHAGRLCGVDPDQASLAVARCRADVEWVAATAATIPWRGEFELAVMTGHAFQVLVADDELRASLAAIRRSLAGDGRFAFETRHPLARAWERWSPPRPCQPGGPPPPPGDPSGSSPVATGRDGSVIQSLHEPR